MLTIEPAAFLQHRRQERLDGAVHRLDVEVEGEVPVLLGAVEHAAVMHVAGAVDENVERAEFPLTSFAIASTASVERTSSLTDVWRS